MEIHPRGSFIYNRYQVEQAPNFKRGILVGGMGFVYICHDTKADRPVALKFFKPEYLSDRFARDRFLREGTAWIELGSHPHIVRCYDVKYIDPTAFLVLELIAKKRGMKDASLRSWMGAPMPIEQALLFALQIARGMQYAVAKIPGFVHRDLKPENILVGADKLPGTNINRVRVTDFGLIKIIADGVVDVPIGNTSHSNHIQSNSILGRGTPQYMAPEQWKDGFIDVYTDVYALGCILYEMLSGQPVVKGKTDEQIRVAHSDGKLRPIPRGLSKPLRAFLEGSLAIEAGNRYQTWNKVTTTLEGLCAGLGVEPMPQAKEQEVETDAERKPTASAYNVRGIEYTHIGKTKKALDYFKKALKIFQEIHDREGEGAVQGNMGNAYAQLGKMDDAFRYCEWDLKIARERKDRDREGVALGSIGDIYRKLGNVDRAIEYYELRLKIVRETGDLRGEGNTLNSLGMTYAALGNVKDALVCYKKQLAITRKIGDRRGRGNAWGSLGNAYAQLGETSRAIFFYNLYLKIAKEIGDWAGEGNALGNLGNVYLTLGDTQYAIDIFYKPSLDIASKTGNKLAEGNALGNLGIAYVQLDRTDDGFKYYKRRLEIAREIGDKDGQCATLFNMGNLYMKNGQVEEAASVWADLYVFARNENLPQALQKLENLAQKFGWTKGLEDWESLAQSMKKL